MLTHKKIAFIGHREIFDKSIKNRLYNEIENFIKRGYTFFTMGTHGEFDKFALAMCRKLRKQYPQIKIEVVLTSINKINPDLKKLDYSNIENINRYEQDNLLPYSDVDTIFYDIEEEHYKRKIVVSNQKMIDECDTLICYVNTNKTYGGAILAYKYAKKKGLQIVNLFK